MAARKQLWHPDEVKARIQASQLINRLTAHALSESGPIMDASQVNAVRILLAKVIPDLASTDVAVEAVVKTVSDKPLSPEEWLATHGKATGS